MRSVAHFPAEWLTDVTVVRGGGRDSRGNPLPTTELPVTDCLVGARATMDPLSRGDLTTADGILYRDLEPGVEFRPTDQVRVPEGAWLAAGVWAVDGEPKRWPLGWEVPLRKEP